MNQYNLNTFSFPIFLSFILEYIVAKLRPSIFVTVYMYMFSLSPHSDIDTQVYSLCLMRRDSVRKKFKTLTLFFPLNG